MSDDEISQDDLAAEWAAALEGQAEAEADAAPAGAEKDPNEALADEWAAALAENEQEEVKQEKEKKTLAAKAQDFSFKDMTEEAKAPRPETERRDMEFILDIPLDVSAELGRTRLLINELLQLGQGSVVELNKLAGEPLEIYVNGKLVARGEAVVINEKFGVRLTDIISPIERVKQLG
ncbi:flagellar motor switch protein FliN [Desulfovibrio sp. OttesenSCG-928-C14]|nr:flagellar motor switch protein FliN [Desulfovibrio sp. OttesenSCG-928-C14]